MNEAFTDFLKIIEELGPEAQKESSPIQA